METGIDVSNTNFVSDSGLLNRATQLHFWKWAFSDLRDDDIKGIFAEWMVRALLGLPFDSGRRVSWADWDIALRQNTPQETHIEVKASAVWQSWKLVDVYGDHKSNVGPRALNPNRIRFGGLCARGGDLDQWTGKQRFKSDFYIFCMQTETDPTTWNAWNLAQWEFFMLSRQKLEDENVGSSVSLAWLRRQHAGNKGMAADEFQIYAKTTLGI